MPGPVSGPGPGLPVRSEASCGGCEARPVQMEGPGHLGHTDHIPSDGKYARYILGG